MVKFDQPEPTDKLQLDAQQWLKVVISYLNFANHQLMYWSGPSPHTIENHSQQDKTTCTSVWTTDHPVQRDSKDIEASQVGATRAFEW